MISISDLRYTRPDGDFTLNIPTLEVASQSAMAVTGPSGSGKTTLLNLIAGILTPCSGHVQIGDTDISQLSESSRRAFRLNNIGLVFQSFELVEYLSVVENVLLPARISPALTLTNELKRRAHDLLVQAGLQRYVGRAVTQLSQGERQRVAICRALLTDPMLLLADEPTGNLDPAASHGTVGILLEQVWNHGATLVMVSHDHTLLNQFDSTIDFRSLPSGNTDIVSGPGDSGAA